MVFCCFAGFQTLQARESHEETAQDDCQVLGSLKAEQLRVAPSPSRRWSAKSIPRKAGHKNLLGGGRWIYRLVCTDDVEKCWDLEKELGSGSFGTVYAARHKELGYHQAVKKIPKACGLSQEEMTNEIYALMDLHHPHIMKLSRMYDDGSNFYIVSELCNGPSLAQRIKERPMSEGQSSMALRHILKAVQCCHSHYYGHFDLKPANFVYRDPECTTLKMIDFGLSGDFTRQSEDFKGTVGYTAPEIWSGVYGPEADIWSCGVILYNMATRKAMCPPRASDEKVQLLVRNRPWVKTKIEAVVATGASPECVDMLKQMLRIDRHMRITAVKALKAPYIEKSYEKRVCSVEKHDNAMAVLQSMLPKFIEFGAEPMLVRAALLVMVHLAGYITTETQAHRYAFRLLDRKGVGEVSLESIQASVHGDVFLAMPEDLGRAFRSVDLDQDGYITYGDFLAATLPHSLRCREDLCQMVFNLFDHNGDGFIDEEDLAAVFLSKEDVSDEDYRIACRDALKEVAGSACPRLYAHDFFRIIRAGRMATPNSQGGFEGI